MLFTIFISLTIGLFVGVFFWLIASFIKLILVGIANVFGFAKDADDELVRGATIARIGFVIGAVGSFIIIRVALS